ncbi:DUF7573 domain-containing protein [Haloarcula nitratireducens]|uniref:DUF7573 domain-containing protein n=1 Tax=Haloarcula nitratireducens TaxID=2487749 RepID=A0AAW4PCH9_9EURY|nr:hypothetical protein [Halomicroarcula nitratireducens]MBX0295375.1 hypothetical protein [Halomicroarcula nitratireducens]
MSEDASLDRFLDEDDAEADESDSAAAESDARDDPVAVGAESASVDGTESSDGEPGDEEPTDDGGVTPATTTYAWSGEGAACGACGGTVERRWQQDGSLVCADCKEWDRS